MNPCTFRERSCLISRLTCLLLVLKVAESRLANLASFVVGISHWISPPAEGIPSTSPYTNAAHLLLLLTWSKLFLLLGYKNTNTHTPPTVIALTFGVAIFSQSFRYCFPDIAS